MMPSLPRWVDYFLSPSFEQGSWANHLAGYWAVRDQSNVLFVTYGEMKQDLPLTVTRVAELMGVALSPEQHSRVVEKSQFAWMKREGAKFDPGKLLPWSGDAPLLRNGKEGGWTEALTPPLARRIDDHCRSELRNLNCDFPYDDAFRLA